MQSADGEHEAKIDRAYRPVDLVLDPWANQHGLTIARRFRDDVVRSVEISHRRYHYQLWVDLPDQDDQVMVHLWWRDRTGSLSWRSQLDSLRARLDECLKLVESSATTGGEHIPWRLSDWRALQLLFTLNLVVAACLVTVFLVPREWAVFPGVGIGVCALLAYIMRARAKATHRRLR